MTDSSPIGITSTCKNCGNLWGHIYNKGATHFTCSTNIIIIIITTVRHIPTYNNTCIVRTHKVSITSSQLLYQGYWDHLNFRQLAFK